MTEVGVSLLIAGALYGFRHGFDVDHLAAISDIAATSPQRKKALRLALLYVTGHALVVLALGFVAVALGATIPDAVDSAMTRVVGVTLIALSVVLLYRIARYGSRARLRSRWMLVADGVRAAFRRLSRPRDVVVIEHSHPHEHAGLHGHDHSLEPPPQGTGSVAVATHVHVHTHVATDPLTGYGSVAALGVGMVHGIGAETPTQMLLFASAAGAGTALIGAGVVFAFVAGLVAANFVVSLVATTSLAAPDRWPRVHVTVAVLVALSSLVIGSAYLFGHADPVGALLGA